MTLLRRAIFFKSALHPEDLPPESRCEIAFAGRSNAGKSSALNALAGHSGLAFVSKTPGRTQLINYYSLGNNRFLVDLPGYGYAKIAKRARKPWGRILGDYLHLRAPLAGLVLVMDIRQALTELDWNLLEWFHATGKPMHALLSKADKLSRSEALMVLQAVRRDLSLRSPLWTAQLFSSLKRTGIDEALGVIGAWLEEEKPRERTVPDPGPKNKKPRAKGE